MAKVRKKVPRRWLRWLLLGAALWVGLPVLAGFVARTPMVRAYFGAEASRALKRELGLDASIADVDVDPENLAVVARGIQLDHPVHGRFADAAVLRIRPSWWALIRGSVDLHSITIEDATLFLKVRDGRIVNLPGVDAATKSSGDELDLPFDWVRVRRSRLVVDAAPVANGEVGPIDIHLDASADDLVVLTLLARGGFVNHKTGREVLQYLQLSGDVTRDSIDVEVLHVKTPTAEVALRDGTISLPDAKTVDGDIDLTVDLAKAMTWPHGLELPNLEGKLHATASLSRDEGKMRGDARIKLTGGVIKWYGLGDELSLSANFDEKHVAFDGVARVDTGEVGVDGQIGLGDGYPTTLNVDIRELSFARLMGLLDVSPNAIVDWNLLGHWELKGTLDPLRLVGPMKMPTRDFRVTRDAYHKSPARHIIAVERALLDGTVHIDDRAFHLRDVDVTMPNSKLNADVLIGFENELVVRAKGIDWNLADSSPLLQFALGGRGSFEMEMGGTLSDPTLSGTATIADFSFHTFPFGDLQTDFELDPDLMGVHFTRMEATKKDSAYALKNAFLDFRNDAFRAGGDLKIARLTLADFYHVFHYTGDERYEPYQGRVEGDVRIDYTMDYPGDGENGTMVATMDLDIPEAELVGYAFEKGHFGGAWRWLDHDRGYRGGELTIDRFSLRKGGGTVNVSGKMGLEGKLDLVTVGDRIAIKDTEGMRDRLSGLNGTYSVTGRVKGTAATPRVDIDLVGTGLSLGGETLGDGRAYVRLTDKDDPWIREALSWQRGSPPTDARCGHARAGLARGHWPEDPPLQTVDGPQQALEKPMAWVVCGSALDGQVVVDLAVGRTDVYPLRGLVTLDKLRFGKLLPRSRHQPPMSGSVTGRIELDDGAMFAPHTLGGLIHLSELRAGQFDVELRNSGPVEMSFGRGAFAVKSADFIGPSSQLYIRGGGSMRDGLALSFSGNVDLGLLSTLSHTVTDAAGTVALEFKVTGKLDRPAVYGHAGIHGGALRLASFPEPVSDVNGKITFSARRVLLESFSANVAGGRLAWRGAATLDGRSIGSYQIDLDAQGMALSPRDGVDMQLGGRGNLEWNRGDRLPLLKGTLRIDDLVYTRPIKMGRDLQDIYKAKRADFDTYDPDADLLAFDLRIAQSQDFVVQNNLIDANLRIEDGKRPFKLVGTDQRYGVLGNMSVRQGTVRFRDAEFDVRQGDISFDDATRIDPTFDLRATTDVRRTTDQTAWHIGIHAWGNRDSFQFDLSSDPYLSQDDIALLLTVGMTHSELAQLEAGELTSTAALEALASVTGVEREVHRALPEIDDFHIASSYSEQSNRTEPQVFIGKRIADRVRLSASTGIAESRDFSTGVELQISDETSVEAVYNNQNSTSTSQLGDVGVDLKWRLEFD